MALKAHVGLDHGFDLSLIRPAPVNDTYGRPFVCVYLGDDFYLRASDPAQLMALANACAKAAKALAEFQPEDEVAA